MTARWFSRLVSWEANAFAHARDRLGPRRLYALPVFVPSATLVLFGAWSLAGGAIALADTLGSYDKVRWIHQDGRERVRVDRQGNRAVAVPEHVLQNKGTRYFVLDTKALPLGSIYVWPLDLNVERGLEVPYKLTLRFARAWSTTTAVAAAS